MRILGIDLGKKRIGIALGDTDNKVVVGLQTLMNDINLWENLREVINRENIEQLVVGLPTTMSGLSGEQSDYTKMWSERAKDKLNIKIEFVDERLSSKMARDGLASMNKPLTKEDIDQAAAVLILQGYLDRSEKSI